MKLETLTGLLTLVVMTSASSYFGQGSEFGRLGARFQRQNFNRGSLNQASQRRDSNRQDGKADQQARWSGQSAVRDNSQAQNELALQRRAQTAGQNFGSFSNNFGNIAKQIRDEAVRKQNVIKDDAQYKQNNANSAQGSNLAKARRTGVEQGGQKSDKINYSFTKKFDKASSENGGFEEENGRNLKKVDLVDEREKDLKLLRGDSEVKRSKSDQQASNSAKDWKSNAAQQQAQDGQYGFADRSVNQAAERSDDRAVDYNRQDSRFQETEGAREEATSLAKDLAEQKAGYNSEASATADANRNVADQKYYGGQELGADGSAAGQDGHAPHGAAEAAAALAGDHARHEGSGGAIKTGFDENAAQHEQGNELASAKALTSNEAVNDYQRNKDKLAYDQRSGLQDRSQGQFTEGLKDTASKGFSGNSAEASKSAEESDRNAANSKSSSDLEAKEKNEKEALRDRTYYRKIQNDDSETFTRRKQFYHNKKEGGNNDENLVYDRNTKENNYGTADEAEMSKQNSFSDLHQDGKVASHARNFEDLVDRHSSQQQEDKAQQAASKSFQNSDAKEEAQAQTASNGFDKGLSKSNKDDSQSSAFNHRQTLQDQSDAQKKAEEDSEQKAKNVSADIEYVQPTDDSPLGDINAGDIIGRDLLKVETEKKGPKEHSLPDVIVSIEPIPAPPKVEKPRHPAPVAPLPEVQQVKTYQPPKHNKPEVNYDTGRTNNFNSFSQPRFSRLGSLSLFKSPRTSSFGSNSNRQPQQHQPQQHQQQQQQQQAAPRSRFSFQRLGGQRSPTSGFSRSIFGNGYSRGGW